MTSSRGFTGERSWDFGQGDSHWIGSVLSHAADRASRDPIAGFPDLGIPADALCCMLVVRNSFRTIIEIEPTPP